MSGTLSRPRVEVQRDIEAAGGKFASSVGKSTDYLVAGADIGEAKLTAARKYGVQIIDEQGLGGLLRGELPEPKPTVAGG